MWSWHYGTGTLWSSSPGGPRRGRVLVLPYGVHILPSYRLPVYLYNSCFRRHPLLCSCTAVLGELRVVSCLVSSGLELTCYPSTVRYPWPPRYLICHSLSGVPRYVPTNAVSPPSCCPPSVPVASTGPRQTIRQEEDSQGAEEGLQLQRSHHRRREVRPGDPAAR